MGNALSQSSRITLLYATFLVLLVIGFLLMRRPELFMPSFYNVCQPAATPPVQAIASKSHLRQAMSAKRAVICVHCAWSVDSAVAQRVVNSFNQVWHERGSSPHVTFFSINLTSTDDGFPEYVVDWLDSNDRLSSLPLSGSGELLWFKNGRLLKVGYPVHTTAHALSLQTQTVFNE